MVGQICRVAFLGKERAVGVFYVPKVCALRPVSAPYIRMMRGGGL